jgi:Ni,Fe-hydrogenase III component G
VVVTENHYVETKTEKIELTSLYKIVEDLVNGYDYARIVTITAVDMGKKFEVSYHIDVQSEATSVQVEVPRENASIPTATDLVPGALLFERDVSELFDIEFKGHPDPQHLLLPDDWPDGLYSLRKELTIEEVQRGGRKEVMVDMQVFARANRVQRKEVARKKILCMNGL